MIKTAIVILNWNGSAMLKRFLPSVIAHSTDDQVAIYVADNASSDDSISMLEEHFPQVKICALSQNYGFAEGYNQALQTIDATYYVLLNSDVEVTPNWLEAPLHCLETQPQVAACQPKILSYQDKTRFEHAGAAGGFIDKYGYPFCRGRILHRVETDQGQYDTPIEIHWASGAAFFIRASLYHEYQLDANFFAYMEEIDLCWRLRLAGYSIMCTPQSTVYHVGAASFKADSPQKTYLNFRNNCLMLYKNMPAGRRTQTFFIRWFLDYLAAFQLLLQGKTANCWSIFRARRDYHRLKKHYKGAIKNHSLASTKAHNLLINKSILFAFYVRGTKNFSEM